MAAVRSDMARGLSPAQIVEARKCQFEVPASTLDRWIGRGHAGMSNMDLRRKVGYKPRRGRAEPRPTPHGPGRSYAAFLSLLDDEPAAACEMDCVIGLARDSQCLPAPCHRPSKAQLALLLSEKTQAAVAGALGMLEHALGGGAFGRLFGTVLTDNGAEFSDFGALEKSALPSRRRAASATTSSCASCSPRGAGSASTPWTGGTRRAHEPAQLDAQAVAHGAVPPSRCSGPPCRRRRARSWPRSGSARYPAGSST